MEEIAVRDLYGVRTDRNNRLGGTGGFNNYFFHELGLETMIVLKQHTSKSVTTPAYTTCGDLM